MEEDLKRLIKSIDVPVFHRQSIRPELFRLLVKQLKQIANGEPVDWYGTDEE